MQQFRVGFDKFHADIEVFRRSHGNQLLTVIVLNSPIFDLDYFVDQVEDGDVVFGVFICLHTLFLVTTLQRLKFAVLEERFTFFLSNEQLILQGL